MHTFIRLLVSESTESKKRFYWGRIIKPNQSFRKFCAPAGRRRSVGRAL